VAKSEKVFGALKAFNSNEKGGFEAALSAQICASI
jgi:hypothetical protein